MIHTEALTKQFKVTGNKTVVAVDQLSLDVAEGEVFGFLGPNGAGKTTTMRMLACLVGPSSGRAWVNGCKVGEDDTAIRRSVGILTESPGLYDRLSSTSRSCSSSTSRRQGWTLKRPSWYTTSSRN
jgi:ABC-2 type transport system ATP-binding protein